jgi:predicted patatin/cPLA2 family phospholipase
VPRKLSSNVKKVALVFEGGGMRASFSSAVVATLLREKIHFDWVGGISAGASCTANYLARDAERARRSFVDFADDPNFGSVGTFLQGKGLFNAHYIYEQTAGPKQTLPYDFDTFWANPARRRISAFRCDTGEAVFWDKSDLDTLPKLMRRVRASSSLPIMMPPVLISGHYYVDGALGPSGGIPLDIAQADGFDRFFVVLTQPRDFVKLPQKMQRVFDVYFRKWPAAAEALAQRHENYNRTREELFDLEASGKACLVLPAEMHVGNSTRDVAALQETYDMGLAQSEAALPTWKSFLGL